MLNYLTSPEQFLIPLAQIIGINIVLSGDNAVVIALASRSLPPDQQQKAVIWGSAAAIVMRIVLTVSAVALLSMPYLKLIGSLFLVWIGIGLLGAAATTKSNRAGTSPARSAPFSSPTW